MGWAWLTLAVGALSALPSHRRQLAGWPSRLALTGAILAIVASPLWRSHYDPRRSAKLLFNSNVAFAYRSGLNPALLMSIDEGRDVASVAGQRGEFTVW